MKKKIYLASPFFNEYELRFVKEAEDILRERGFDVFSPREHQFNGAPYGTHEWAAGTFESDVEAIDGCDVLVMLYHGNYSDSGTAWECGYAFGIKKPAVVVHTSDDMSNLMVHESVRANISMDDLNTYDFEKMPPVIYEGPMT